MADPVHRPARRVPHVEGSGPQAIALTPVDDVLGDPERLGVLEQTGLMNPVSDARLDHRARLAAEALGTPIALVVLVDDRRQRFGGLFGLTGWAADARGTALTHSFCKHVVSGGQPLVVDDARTHEVMRDNAAVADLGVVAYAGAPIRVSGQSVGALCVIDPQPRTWSAEDVQLLEALADGLGGDIELGRTSARRGGGPGAGASRSATTPMISRADAFERLDRLLGDRVELSVLSIDLDRLRRINDSLGHDAGDAVVAEAAQRLCACADPGDLVARLAGEEFLIVSAGGHDHAARIAARTLAALRLPLELAMTRDELTITASIGVFVVADDLVTAPEAVRRADSAMRAAKGLGGDTFTFFDSAAMATASRRLRVETALRHAVDRDELSLVFQPLHGVVSGRPTAVETLVRWRSAELGLVEPAEFIPIAEETGLIHAIGAWVIAGACATLPALSLQYGCELSLGINASARQLRDPLLAERMAESLAQHGLSADRVFVEITETALIDSDAATDETLRALEAMGARIALDDFGTGYSSLAVLKRNPISSIKIDRSFVAGLPDDNDDLAIVTALTRMAQSLGLAVIAEGVETQQQYDTVRALGCDYAQGFLLGRPAPALHPPASTAGPDADQRSDDRDHAAAAREAAAAARDTRAARRDESQADVDEESTVRDDAFALRELDAAARDLTAAGRGGEDRVDEVGDDAASDRDHASADRGLTVSDRSQSRAASVQRGSDRDEAATDRVHAATDRAEAAIDRAAAIAEREQARGELVSAQHDQLTGALGRGLGMVALEREVNRARHGNGQLVLAYVDVDGLKAVNDNAGHSAGDALLADVVAAIRGYLRSYDPIVRVGGDEFVCALTDCGLDAAHERFDAIRDKMAAADAGASISVGFAELRPSETLAQLSGRADAALYKAKRRGRPEAA